MISLTVNFQNNQITNYYDLLYFDLEPPYVVVFEKVIDEKSYEFRLHLDPQKTTDLSDLGGGLHYQGLLLSSDIVVQEIACN